MGCLFHSFRLHLKCQHSLFTGCDITHSAVHVKEAWWVCVYVMNSRWGKSAWELGERSCLHTQWFQMGAQIAAKEQKPHTYTQLLICLANLNENLNNFKCLHKYIFAQLMSAGWICLHTHELHTHLCWPVVFKCVFNVILQWLHQIVTICSCVERRQVEFTHCSLVTRRHSASTAKWLLVRIEK